MSTTHRMHPYQEDHPLRSGITLLEASAGTGKTYSVTFLYLRLLLEQRLTPSEIVVVTFTRAAAAELRDRIHARIAHAEETLIALNEGRADLEDAEVIKLQKLLERATVEDPLATLQSSRALLDTSTISTIHKFAGRLSDEFAMVTGTPSQATLVQSLDSQLDDALRDLEHQLAEAFPIECEAIANPKLKFSQTVRELANKILNDPDVDLLPEFLVRELATPAVMALQARNKDLLEDSATPPAQRFAQRMQSAAKRLLNGELDSMEAWFTAVGDNTRIPKGKISKRAVAARLEKLRALCNELAGVEELEKVNDIAQRVFAEQKNGEKGIRDLFKYFSYEYLESHHKSFSGICSAEPTVQELPLFAQDADLLIALNQILETDVYDRIWMQRVAQKVAAMVEERTAMAGVRSHAHIISDIVEALESEHREALIDVVSTRYKAALIDEFQDTDLRQWKIFSELFGDDAITYLIGDPKQAIYGFRGANVAVYEQVRDGLPADRVMTLDTNYRSDFAYNEAVNGLFGAVNRVNAAKLEGTYAEDFVARYLAVKSPPRTPEQRMKLEAFALPETHKDARQYVTNGAPTAALVIRETQVKSRAYRDWSAANIAKEIAQLLQADSSSRIYEDGAWRVVRPRDCAVIVRGRPDAGPVVDALRRAGIPAVARDHQSVALSDAADGLQHWLAAIDEPARTANLRAFLCSPIVGLQLEELDAMSEQDLSDWTSFFDELKRLWWRRGLHASLRSTLHRAVAASERKRTAQALNGSAPENDDALEDVMSRLLRRDEGSRIAGDLMHLAEVLNVAQRAESLSPRGLSDWFSRRRHEAQESPSVDELFKRRVESDAEAVEVVTAHSSKGLEYNLVWLMGLTETNYEPSFLIDPNLATTRYVVDKDVYRKLASFAAEELEIAGSVEAAQQLETARRDSAAYQNAARYIQAQLESQYPSLNSPLLASSGSVQEKAPFSLHAALHASVHSSVNEDLRLLYVALTRARMRSVIYHGACEKIAADLVLLTLDSKAKKGDEPTPETPYGTHRLERSTPWPDTTLSIEQWFIEKDDATVHRYQLRDYEETRDRMEPRTAPEVRSTRKQMTSYSSLSRLLPDHFAHFRVSEEPILDEEELNNDADARHTLADDTDGTEIVPVESPLPLANFSSGREAGTALHHAFEEIDFVGAAHTPLDPAYEEELALQVTTALVSNGLNPSQDAAPLTRGILAVLQTPIGGVLGETRLADISRADRIDELEFYMPMGDGQHGTTAQNIFRVLSTRRGDPAIAERWFDDLEDTGIESLDLNGLLTGFIDLVFRREVNGVTQYFIADYKSNRIVPQSDTILPGAFTREAVLHEMALHHYYLQYHIYLVALHRWLRARLPTYDYDTHVGGAYYFFVRGMSGADTPLEDGYARGVFFDRPSREVIDALDLAFQRAESRNTDLVQEP